MKIQRVILLAFLIALVSAGLFGDDPKTERKKKREADKLSKKDKKSQKQKNGPSKDEVLLESDIEEILADALIVDTATPEDDIKLKNDEVYKLWEKNMHDFVPEDLTNFVVDASSATVLYEDIGHLEETLVKGAYYVHGGQDAKVINVFVQDPNKNIIYKRSNEVQGIILFNSTVPGQYAFIFSNLDDSAEKTATLAIHTYEEKEEAWSYNEHGERVDDGWV